MFKYFKRQEYTAEPLYVHSVSDAIKDFEREKKDFKNLKYSAAYFGRTEEMCDECRMRHPPLKPNILEAKQIKK